VIRAEPTTAQRAEVEQRLAQGERPGAIALRTGLHRRDIEAIATDTGVCMYTVAAARTTREGSRPRAASVHPVATRARATGAR
jgi:predicted xylose isomerase-like sugar epimerase